MEIIFTHHAIEQFISRYNKRLTSSAAKEILKRHAGIATKSDQKTHGGEYYWDIVDLDVRLVTKLDKAQHVCVTVVPLRDKFRDLQEQILREQELLDDVAVVESVDTPMARFNRHTVKIVVEIECDIPSDIVPSQAKNKIKEGIEAWVRANANTHVLVVTSDVEGVVTPGDEILNLKEV
jgi:hypothetical protein